MAITTTIQIPRGVEANLPTLAAGQLALATDTNELWIGTGGGNVSLTGGAGATTFVALTDTPANYTGAALKVVRVDAGETALEFRSYLLDDCYNAGSAVVTVDGSPVALTTTGNQAALQVNADNLTNSAAIYVLGNGTDATARDLAYCANQNALATGCIVLHLYQGSTAPALKLSVSEDGATIQLVDLSNSRTSSIYLGDTSPEGRLTANVGSIFIDNSGGKIWKKTSGTATNTNWHQLLFAGDDDGDGDVNGPGVYLDLGTF